MLLCRKVSSAPVVNADGSLAGIVAERDIMEALGFSDGWSAPVERFMKTGVIQYEPETPAAMIFEFLCRVQIHRVVIVENTRPVGLISRGTFFALGAELRPGERPVVCRRKRPAADA